MYNVVFQKAIENVTKHRKIRKVTTERKSNHLVSEPSYLTKKFFTENLLAKDMRKTQLYK